MGPGDLGDFTLAKHTIHGPPVDWGLCVSGTACAPRLCPTLRLFYQQLSQRSRTHVYQNTICQEAKRVNSIDTRQNQKLGFRKQMRLLAPNQQGEI